MNGNSGRPTCAVLAALLGLFLIPATFLLLPFTSADRGLTTATTAMATATTSTQQQTELQGILHTSADAIEFIYQLPPAAHAKWAAGNAKEAALDVKGILFLAHGCSHSGTDWWPKSSTCSSCTGLPVERSIVGAALQRGFLTVAQSSHNRNHKCWSEPDLARVERTLSWLEEQFSLAPSTPIHLLGASSGGNFVGRFAVKHSGSQQNGKLRVSSAVVQISPIQGVSPPAVPSSLGLLFVHMGRDEMTADFISRFVAEAGRSSVKEFIAKPLKLTPSFFHDHGAHLSLSDSASLVEALSKAGLVGKDGFLSADPRSSTWRDVAAKVLPATKDSLVADASGVSELLNLAWAQHEITDERLEEQLDFMKAYK
jgi:hypothetical protein